MPDKHAKIGASSMVRQLKCPGSIAASDGLSVPDSEWSAAGTEYAEKMEAALNSYVEGRTTPSTDDSIEWFVDWLERNIVDRRRWSYFEFFIEEYMGDDHFGGTPDLLVYDHGERKLWVIDFKNGVHPVLAEENFQCGTYHHLFVEAYADKFPVFDAEYVIYQPNSYGDEGVLNRWEVELEWFEGLQAAIEVLVSGEYESTFSEGVHCQYCPAAEFGKCPLKGIALEKGLTTIGSPVTTVAVHDLSDEQLRLLVERGDELKKFIDKAKKHAFDRLNQGGDIEGVKLVQTFKNRKWSVSEDQIKEQLGEDALVTKLVSPAEAERRGHTVDNLVERPTGTALVPVSDPRPSINESTTVEDSDFEDVQRENV